MPPQGGRLSRGERTLSTIVTRMEFEFEKKVLADITPSFKVGVITDSQLSPFFWKKMNTFERNLRRACMRMAALKPDILIFAGDICNIASNCAYGRFMRALGDAFKESKPHFAVIMGNHDYFPRPEIAALRRRKFIKNTAFPPFWHYVAGGYHFVGVSPDCGSLRRGYDGVAPALRHELDKAVAASGKRPFISVYSSFLQRAYDQINHDVARMKLPVVIGIDLSAYAKMNITILPMLTAGNINFVEFHDALIYNSIEGTKRCCKIDDNKVRTEFGDVEPMMPGETVNEDNEAVIAGTNLMRPFGWYQITPGNNSYAPRNCDQLPLHIIRFMLAKLIDAEENSYKGFFGSILKFLKTVFGTMDIDELKRIIGNMQRNGVIKDKGDGIEIIKRF